MINEKQKIEKKLTSTKKLKLVFIIVKRSKTDYYLDLMQENGANMQLSIIGNGTTKSTIFAEEVANKSIIISVVTEDHIPKILKDLKDKFGELRDGKGVAWVVPFDSVMGVTFFNFLSNNKGSII